MEFLKKHYEKILLSVVLLGLVGATLWLPQAIKEAEADLQVRTTPPAKPKGLPPLDLSVERQSMQVVTNSQPVVLSGDHNVFNPVTWKMAPGGTLKKILVEGPQALSITAIKPVLMTISYDRSAGAGYYLNVHFQSGKRIQEYAKVGEKTRSGIFIIHEVKGTPEDPSELVLELAGSQELVPVSKSQPYEKVESYLADLKYDPETKTFTKQRVNDILTISGEVYKIVAITSNEVRVSNQIGKQTTVTWTGTAAP